MPSQETPTRSPIRLSAMLATSEGPKECISDGHNPWQGARCVTRKFPSFPHLLDIPNAQGSACIYKVAKRVSWKLGGMGEKEADVAHAELKQTYAGIVDLIDASGVEEWASVWRMETVTGLGGNASGKSMTRDTLP